MKLTNAERANIEALFHALADEVGDHVDDVIPPDLYAVFESIAAARLEQQREALAAAIEAMPQTVMSPRKAALTIREYGTGEQS